MIYLRLIWSYLKIGLFGFGGGYAMLALIENEIVTPGWITEKMFTDIVAISQMTPGPIGINSATYIGYVAPTQTAGLGSPLWGVLGSLICTIVVVLPSFLLVRYAGHY
ncbi:MAG: chromate transporter, partial [Muribaculaceae bacterium]|nr:chromate transporter [Muribaculaceae bacterium]